MKELLRELSETKLVKITGSYADGTQNESSDIDFYVKPDIPDYKFYKKERNISKIIKILSKYGIKWESIIPGYIHTHNVDFSLETPLEFSDLYEPRKNKFPTVIIHGIKFKTY